MQQQPNVGLVTAALTVKLSNSQHIHGQDFDSCWMYETIFLLSHTNCKQTFVMFAYKLPTLFAFHLNKPSIQASKLLL